MNIRNITEEQTNCDICGKLKRCYRQETEGGIIRICKPCKYKKCQ